jgi:hypothetical protein
MSNGATPAADITIPHGPAQYVALVLTIAAVLGGLATALTTLAGALPSDVPANVGAGITAAAGVVSAISAAIYAFIRYLNGKLHIANSESVKTAPETGPLTTPPA